jgi:copper homeostasis protein
MRYDRRMHVLLEICIDDPASLDAAIAGGADRIELCAALELGGLTPSAAMLARGVASGLPVHAMIRPRAGGFVLDEGEAALMIDEIGRMIAGGAAGVVVGALLPDSTLDRAALARFREAARDAAIVLHRAVDLTPDPVAAVAAARALGFDAVLSSGGALTATEGAPVLRRMVETAGEALDVIAGAGVTFDNVAQLVAETGVRAVHGSASVVGARADPDAVRLGFGTASRRRTDAEIVRRMRAELSRETL